MNKRPPHSWILTGLTFFLIHCAQPGGLVIIGGHIDSLIAYVEQHDLQLNYMFATHCHMDHIEGVRQIQKHFPEALLCYNQRDFEDFLISREWMAEHFPNDKQTYILGNLEMRTLLTPEHSRGGVCFCVNDVLFSGDVLFYRNVGRTDLLGGSKDHLVTGPARLQTAEAAPEAFAA